MIDDLFRKIKEVRLNILFLEKELAAENKKLNEALTILKDSCEQAGIIAGFTLSKEVKQ